MSEYNLTTSSPRATKRIAEKLALLLRPGSVITLEGELGVGKTVFAKGIANGLGVKEPVTSPTFTIIKEYEGELPFYHIDAYRLEFSEEDIGFDEYFSGSGITVIEWAQFIEDFLPKNRLQIEISYVNEHSREITFVPEGSEYDKVVKRLL